MKKLLKSDKAKHRRNLVLGYTLITFWLCLALLYYQTGAQGLACVAVGGCLNGFFCILYVRSPRLRKVEVAQKRLTIDILARITYSYKKLGGSDQEILNLAADAIERFSEKD